MAHVLGIDIGGSGIKAAPVDTATGQLLAERQKLATPQPSTPDGVDEVAAAGRRPFDWTGPAGITFPGVVASGVIRTAANVDHSWIGVDAVKTLAQAPSWPSPCSTTPTPQASPRCASAPARASAARCCC